MKFTATTTFLHDRTRYEEGKEYDEPPALANYFVLSGWAHAPGKSALPQPQDVTLDIHNVKVAAKASNAGKGG